MRTITLLAFVAGALMLSASRLQAQSYRFGIGPKLGFYLNNGNFAIGALGEFPITGQIYIEPGIEVVTGIDNTLRLIFDGNVRYAFQLPGLTLEPYALGGVGIRFDTYTFGNASSTNTSFHVNIGGGVTFSARSTVQPWGGIKIYFVDEKGSDFLLQGGVNFYF